MTADPDRPPPPVRGVLALVSALLPKTLWLFS